MQSVLTWYWERIGPYWGDLYKMYYFPILVMGMGRSKEYKILGLIYCMLLSRVL